MVEPPGAPRNAIAMSITCSPPPTREVRPDDSQHIAVVIPCYRVRTHTLQFIAGIGPEVGRIIAVDDACPEASGAWIRAHCTDPRVIVVQHEQNQGVGGATLIGYHHALQASAHVVVKLDGDGQVDAGLLPRFANPLLSGHADYAKGNRFHRVGFVRGMPWVRLAGNAALSFMTKLSSGYWRISDPTNGYTAIRSEVLYGLELEGIAKRYFFESDLLYHLNQVRAVVIDVPMRAGYENETSSLSPLRILGPFLPGHLRITLRRRFYSYGIRSFSQARVELLLGSVLLAGGGIFGLWWRWCLSADSGVPATAGTVMIAGLPIIMGMQMLLSWLNFDEASEPLQPVHRLLGVEQALRSVIRKPRQ